MAKRDTKTTSFTFEFDTPVAEIIATVTKEVPPIPAEPKPPEPVEPKTQKPIESKPGATPRPEPGGSDNSNEPALSVAAGLLAAGRAPSDSEREILKNYRGTGVDLNNQEALGQFLTPYEVCEFITKCLPENPGRVFDPTCGTARMAEFLPPGSSFSGLELQGDATRIGKLLYPQHIIEQGNILKNLHFIDCFDVVMGNPPFGLWWRVNPKKWNVASASGKIVSQWAVLELSIKAVKPGGIVALVVPQNTFTNDRAADHRAIKFWDSNCFIRAMFHLPRMTFKESGTTWPCSILIIQKPPCRPAEEYYEATIKSADDFKEPLGGFLSSDSHAAMIESFGQLVSKRVAKPVFTGRVNEEHERNKSEFKRLLDADLSVETKDDVVVVSRSGQLLQLKPVGLIAAVKLEEWKQAKGDMFHERWEQHCTVNKLVMHGQLESLSDYGLNVAYAPDLKNFLRGKRRLYSRESSDMKMVHKNYPVMYQKKLQQLRDMGLWDLLFPYQRHDAIIHSIKRYSFLGYIQGLGKTRTSIAAVMLKGTKCNLFVCFSRLTKVWRDELLVMGVTDKDIKVIRTENDLLQLKKWNIISFETLRNQKKPNPPVECPICGMTVKGKICQGEPVRKHRYDNPDKKTCGWNRLKDAVCPECKEDEGYTGRYCKKCGYAAHAWEPGIYKRMRKIFSCIVVDESQASKNKNSLQGRALRTLKAKNKMVLTGTMLENYVSEAYFQLHWLLGGGSARFPYPFAGGHSMFNQQYSVFEKTKSGRLRMKPDVKNVKQFWKMMDAIMTRRTEKDVSVAEVIKLPEAKEVKVKVEPTKGEKELYEKAMNDFEAWYEAQLLERCEMPSWKRGEFDRKLSALVLVKLNMLRHISSAPFTFSDYSGNGTAKVKAITAIVKKKIEQGEKVLVSSAFKALVRKLETELPDCESFTGDMLIDKRNEIMGRFQKEEYPKVLCVTTQCCNLGVTLTSASCCILSDYLWSPKQMEQMWKRVHRVGQTKPVEIIYMINEGFIDEEMDSLVVAKAGAIDKAIDKVENMTPGVYLSPIEFANRMLTRRGRSRATKLYVG